MKSVYDKQESKYNWPFSNYFQIYKQFRVFGMVLTIPLPRFSLFVMSDIIVVDMVTEPFSRPPMIREIKNMVKVSERHHTR